MVEIDESLKEAYAMKERIETKRKILEANERPNMFTSAVNYVSRNLVLIVYLIFSALFIYQLRDYPIMVVLLPLFILFAVLRNYNAQIGNSETLLSVKQSIDSLHKSLERMNKLNNEVTAKANKSAQIRNNDVTKALTRLYNKK